jgi:hypothetical protein
MHIYIQRLTPSGFQQKILNANSNGTENPSKTIAKLDETMHGK